METKQQLFKVTTPLRTMKRSNILLVMLLCVGMLQFGSSYLGTYEVNDCVNIKVMSNCTSVNLTLVETNTETYVINSAMQALGGQVFNYTFCNTSEITNYNYIWDESCRDCSGGVCGNNFGVTYTGQKVSLSNSIIVVVFLIIAIMFLVLAFSFSEEHWMLRTFFNFCAVAMGILAVNSAKIIASESLNLGKMGNVGLTIMVAVFAIFFLYIFVYYFIETVKSLKEKRGVRWNYD